MAEQRQRDNVAVHAQTLEGFPGSRALVAFISIMMAALLLSSCAATQNNAEATAAPAAVVPTAMPAATAMPAETGANMSGATVGEIAANPDNYFGKTVTVSGVVGGIVSPRAFTIGGEQYVPSGQVLVVDKNTIDELVNGNAEQKGFVNGVVQVTGPVRKFDSAAFAKELGVDLNENLLSSWNGKPAVIAQDMNITLTNAANAGQNGQNGAQNGQNALTVADIVSNPNAYAGKTVTLTADAQDTIGDHGLKLDESAPLQGGIDNDLLVLGAAADNPAIDPNWLNNKVTVTGTVRMFNITDVGNEVGYTLDPSLFNDYANKPVLIASTISPASDVPNMVRPTVAPNAGLPAIPDATAVPNAGANTNANGVLQVADIMSNPDAYIGKQITLRGEAEQVYGSSAFKLDDNSPLRGGIDNDLLVIGANQNNPAIDNAWLNQVLTIKGTVKRYISADFERDYNWLNLDPQINAQFESKPVLVADSVQVVGNEAVVNDQAADAGASVGANTGAANGTVTVADIVSNPSAYVGKKVTIVADAQDRIGDHGLKLDEDSTLTGGIDNDLLVLGAAANNPAIDPNWLNNKVRVTGTVRMFNRADIANDVGYDLDASLYNDYEAKPVLIADSITQL